MNTVLELTNIIAGNKALLARLLLSLLLAAPWVTTASADEAPFLPNLSTLPTSSSNQQTFLSAEQAFQIDWVANDTGWTVSFDIEPGYYLYLERIKLVGFEPGQVEKSSLTETPRLSFRQLPETKFDKNFGLVEVFHDRLNIEITHAGLSTLVLSWQGCSDQQLCYPPQKTRLHAGQDMNAIPGQKFTEFSQLIGSHTGSDSDELSAKHQDQIGLLQVWRGFVVIGLSLLFTSCVIPLIPMVIALVSSAQQQHSPTSDAFKGLGLAVAFVLGVASSYALIGALAASLGASVNLVALTQTPWVIYLAAALVAGTGVYLVWPNKSPDSDREAFFNAADRLVTLPDMSQTGHGLTAFMIGLTAAFIVSPCISAPIGGALTSLANQANPLLGGSAMFVMGLTIGLPVLIAAGLTSLILSQQPNAQQLVRPGCGLALMFVALILVDRVVNDSILLGITGIFALALGVYFGGLNAYQIPQGDEAANHASPLNKARQAGAMVLMALGLIWMIGSAMGNKSWLQPLASETFTSAATASGFSGRQHQPSSLIHRTPDALLSAINNGDPRMVVVDITADWCSGCEDLNRLLDSQRIQSTLATSGIRLLRFDITHTQREQLDLLASLGVFGPPALQPFRPNGSPLGSPLHGVPSASELSDWLTTLQP